MSKPPTNPSSHQFSSSRELPSFQQDLQSRLLLPLQGQLPKTSYPKHPTLLHPPPDASDLGMYQPTKKLKSDDNPLNMLMDHHAAMSLFSGLAPGNKQPLDIPSIQEPLIVPELRPLGFESQQQAMRQSKGRNPSTMSFPGFESAGRSQLSHPVEAGFPNLSSLVGDPRAEELLMGSQGLGRNDALRNMLLMQALQNPNDVLTTRLLQAQAQQQAQAQAQLLGHPSFQLPQGMRLPGYGGVNPMTLQYLELQKQLALMQAQAQAAQAMQAAQRIPGAGPSLADSLGGRYGLNDLVKLESGLQLPFGLDPQLRMMYNEALERPSRRDEIPELYERLGRGDNNVKKEDTEFQLSHQLQQQQQQQVLRLQQQQQQQQRNEEKLQAAQAQARKNLEKPTNGFVQPEREVRPQKEIRIEQPKPEPKVVPRNEPRTQIVEEDPREFAKAAAKGRGRPMKEVPPKPVTKIVQPVQPQPVLTNSRRETRESRETRRTSSRLQGSQIRYDQFSDEEEEEEKVMPVTRSNNARNTRSSSKKTEPATPAKPVVINVPSSTLRSSQEKGIVQPKELFTSKFFSDYQIEVYLPNEHVKTVFKRTPLGRAHQVWVYDCELNDEDEDYVPMRQPPKLVSTPAFSPEDEVEEIQLQPQAVHIDQSVPHTIKSKEIKVGEDHQAYIPELNLNEQMAMHQRHFKLLVNPNNA